MIILKFILIIAMLGVAERMIEIMDHMLIVRRMELLLIMEILLIF
jgi:hypothetical protein|nr:MAG TPA: hypothetical protein [Caudoviricetes sp.]DAV54024.1 MAG TPA: hypothetical protein [Caudoviricetes sp.]